MTTLFDSIERTETRAMGRSEDAFTYYNTSARPFIAAMRETMEEWFEAYPEAEQADLRGRFRSKDHHESAKFELFVHALLHSMGFEMEPHPALPNGKCPEFRVYRDGEPLFYAEATIAKVRRDRDRDSRGVHRVEERINEIGSLHFWANLNFERIGPGSPPLRRINAAFTKLASLGPDEVQSKISAEGWDAAPSAQIRSDGWDLTIRVHPRSSDKQPERTVFSVMTPVIRLDTRERIRQSVRAKAGRYGELDLPYVIAVNVMEDHLDDIDMMESLFGKERWRVNFDDDSKEAAFAGRESDGAFFRPGGFMNTRVSAVFMCDRISTGDVFTHKTSLIHHPEAVRPFPPEWWPMPQLVPDPTTHMMVERPGQSAGEVLGLPTPWPPTEE